MGSPVLTKRVFVCSKLSGDIENNIEFARQACKWAVHHGVAPFAPHAFYTQFLDDTSEEDRELGILSGLGYLTVCDEMWVFYRGELEWSSGMKEERKLASVCNIKIRIFKEVENGFEEKQNV